MDDLAYEKVSSPSFTGLSPASEASSRSKRGNRRRDTKQEILLRKELWKLGLRFHKNVETMAGKPDIVFNSARVVVFCDGDFWHGRRWSDRRPRLDEGANSRYWVAKIASNMERDRRITNVLEQAGWLVIRLWETDIKRAPTASAEYVAKMVRDRLSEHNGIVPRQVGC